MHNAPHAIFDLICVVFHLAAAKFDFYRRYYVTRDRLPQQFQMGFIQYVFNSLQHQPKVSDISSHMTRTPGFCLRITA